MLGVAAVVNSDFPNEEMQKVRAVCVAFERAVRAEVDRRQVVPALFDALQPCHLLCVLDRELLHIVFTRFNAGGMPQQTWRDRRSQTPVPHREVIQAAEEHLGFRHSMALHFSANIVEAGAADRDRVIEKVAKEHIEAVIKAVTRPRAAVGYEHMQSSLDNFTYDNPDFEKNVFIAMRFRDGKQFTEIHEAIRTTLAEHGLKGLRSDSKTYPADGDLWTNVCVYMMGCKYVICVFEEIDEREFNPNIPLEYGFMRAINRQVLLLKDKRMPNMPSDIIGKLYRNFDTYNIGESIREQVSLWVSRDLGIAS